jgi:hypothetical protein
MIWKLLVVAVTVLVVFGRSGARRHPLVRVMLGNGGTPPRRPASAPGRPWFSDRLFLLLVVTAATAIAALVLGKLFLDASTGPAR